MRFLRRYSSPPSRRALIAALAVLALRPSPPAARAEEAGAKADAARAFDHALELADRGQLGAALAEFQRAYALRHHPAVLYNLGSTYARLGRPIEAIDALERYLAESGVAVDASRRAAVEAEIARQRARIGALAIRTAPTGAEVRVDGAPVGKTPLDGPLSLAAGSHLVDATLDGHERAERAILLGGGERLNVDLTLERAARSGLLLVDCDVPDVDVRIDGSVQARTPVPGPLRVPAGTVPIEFERAGYQPVVGSAIIGAAGLARVACALHPSSKIPRSLASTMTLRVAETDAQVRVDGQPAAAGSLVLPAGAHHVLVERAGFHPWLRSLSLRPGVVETIDVTLTPTTRYADDYQRRARGRRRWAVAAGIAGLSAAIGAVSLFAWNDGRYSDWVGERNAVDAAWAACQPACDPSLDARQSAADRKIESVQRVDKITVGLGVAAVALLAAGIALFLTGDDPGRYQRSAP